MVDLSKKIKLIELEECYAALLTEKQRQIFEMYYFEDWSLFEIAEKLEISRQAVHDSLTKTEQFLLETEQKCGFLSKNKSVEQSLIELQSSLNTADPVQAKISAKLHEIITKL